MKEISKGIITRLGENLKIVCRLSRKKNCIAPTEVGKSRSFAHCDAAVEQSLHLFIVARLKVGRSARAENTDILVSRLL